MRGKNLPFEQLYDIRAVRVIVKNVRECYAVLGVVHDLWTPVEGEFDDYIASPKANDYRSLHTAVVGPEGRTLEVQIRTEEMHLHSEHGVAAHWRYKEGRRADQKFDAKIAWLRQVLAWKADVLAAEGASGRVPRGLFEETIYVLTPQGRVVDLPAGSTPVDFAYHVHTDLGHRCRGAKVDGQMVPLTTKLANAQRVEIVAAKQGGPVARLALRRLPREPAGARQGAAVVPARGLRGRRGDGARARSRRSSRAWGPPASRTTRSRPRAASRGPRTSSPRWAAAR